MNNINPDKEKLLKILNELERDYQAGNISDEKYKYLSKQYNDRLSDINAVDRIRTMQGKKVIEDVSSNVSKRNMAEKSKKEDEQLVDKYIVKSEEDEKKTEGHNKKAYVVIASAFFIVAFIAGIGFGVFNFDFQATSPANAVVTINETAFPIVTSNVTNKTTSHIISDNGDSKNGTGSEPTPDSNPDSKPDSKPDSTLTQDSKSSNNPKGG